MWRQHHKSITTTGNNSGHMSCFQWVSSVILANKGYSRCTYTPLLLCPFLPSPRVSFRTYPYLDVSWAVRLASSLVQRLRMSSCWTWAPAVWSLDRSIHIFCHPGGLGGRKGGGGNGLKARIYTTACEEYILCASLGRNLPDGPWIPYLFNKLMCQAPWQASGIQQQQKTKKNPQNKNTYIPCVKNYKRDRCLYEYKKCNKDHKALGSKGWNSSDKKYNSKKGMRQKKRIGIEDLRVKLGLERSLRSWIHWSFFFVPLCYQSPNPGKQN